MFIDHLIIAVVFRIINFAILICIAVYVFKKYALPFIYELMAQEELEKKLLVSQQILFEQKQCDLDELIYRDALLYENLKIKIDEWKKVSAQERCAQEKSHQEAFAAIEKKQIKKRMMLHEAHVQSVIASVVVSDLDISLKKYFEEDINGEKYLNDIIHVISER